MDALCEAAQAAEAAAEAAEALLVLAETKPVSVAKPSFCRERALDMLDLNEPKLNQMQLMCNTLVEMQEKNVASFTKKHGRGGFFDITNVEVLRRDEWFAMWTALELQFQTKKEASTIPLTAVYEMWLACGMMAVRSTKNKNKTTTAKNDKKSLLATEYVFRGVKLVNNRLQCGRKGNPKP